MSLRCNDWSYFKLRMCPQEFISVLVYFVTQFDTPSLRILARNWSVGLKLIIKYIGCCHNVCAYREVQSFLKLNFFIAQSLGIATQKPSKHFYNVPGFFTDLNALVPQQVNIHCMPLCIQINADYFIYKHVLKLI